MKRSKGARSCPSPRCILTCFRFVAARRRAEKSSNAGRGKERGGKGRGRMPISPLRSVKILNYASTIDDRVVLFRWIKKKGKKKKRRKGMRGFFFFFLIFETDVDYYSIRFTGRGRDENTGEDSLRYQWFTRFGIVFHSVSRRDKREI